jgi:hypothetical protein
MRLAVKLAEEGYSLAYIAEKIGKSREGARLYIQEGQKEAQWDFLLDAAQDKASLRAFLAYLTDQLIDEMRLQGKTLHEYLPGILQLVDRRAKLVGTWAAKKHEVSDLREAAGVDPVTEAQVDATLKEHGVE